MDMKKRLQREWIRLEERYNELSTMLDELHEFTDYQDANIKTTAAYMVMKNEMEEIAKTQSLYEQMGVLRK